MWKDKQTELLASEIEKILISSPQVAAFNGLIEEAIAFNRHHVSKSSRAQNQPWSLLPLIVCEAISGKYRQALPAAATLHLLKIAAEILDDIEDGDSSESLASKYGDAIAINVATTLIMLAENAVTRLYENGFDSSWVINVIGKINSYHLTACAGQHQDLSLNPALVLKEEEYLKIVRAKAAVQVECACHIGALVSGGKLELVKIFTEFGQNLGMASQIANDIQDITGGDPCRIKITLPLIYFFNHTEGNDLLRLDHLGEKHSIDSISTRDINQLIFNSGAMHYAFVKMETYRQSAVENLFDARNAGINIERLVPFLDRH